MHPQHGVKLLMALLLTSTALNAETRYFLAIETVNANIELDYANGREDYELSSGRIKFGAELVESGIVGFEFLSAAEDEIVDPFGTPFELSTDASIGIFAHMGRPFYLRLAYSEWNAEYADLGSGLVDEEKLSTLEYGLGYQLWLGSSLSIYADYSIRHTDAEFPLQFVGDGLVKYESQLLSVGLSAAF
jgi:hypothetical protein